MNMTVWRWNVALVIVIVSLALGCVEGLYDKESDPSYDDELNNGGNNGGSGCAGRLNACGGCEALSSTPGASCGSCGEYACNGQNAVRCVERSESLCAGMVEVPAGNFIRGSDVSSNEQPVSTVYLDGYWIDETEVTVDAYAACVSAGTCSAPGTGNYCNWGVSGRGSHPVNCVNWTQSDTYCRWAGKGLPTEGEWEKAARGTDGRTYPWGEASPTCSYAVMGEGGLGCGQDRTWPVGSKPAGASPYGAQDMAGNVWEWVSDRYSPSAYADAGSMRNPEGPISGSLRVERGGGFGNDDAGTRRAAARSHDDPAGANVLLGFRCAR